ncbi:ribosomal RNA-processing protein 7-domain-containing protein [Irpex rosettiformis]|uniref:Ribosomal RNA-processing protein 7-domain-containing protein n=1 Tax=Irpex rosettiformis TaxID=378272 RepID=A0ACB8UCZ8_9APHY|nr:ribosomal RNA-processing protein 7-domain-containing protein [Irpex rosettiformis]
MSANSLKSVAGFTLITVKYSPDSTHFVYVRAHTASKKGKARDTGLPDGRTLFMVNVPPDATEREIAHFFKSSGTVERVVFAGDDMEETLREELVGEELDESEDEEHEMEGVEEIEADVHPRKKRKMDKVFKTAPLVTPLPTHPTRVLRKTGRSAHVVFLDDSSLTRALASASRPRIWAPEESTPSGIDHYLALYRSHRPPLDVVKAHANSWMEHFDWEQAKKKQQSKYKKGEAIVDDDGFTLVARGGAYGQSVGGGVGVASKRFQREGPEGGKRHRKKKESKEKDAFYSFQIHEKKRKELLDLKQKWEEDKAKVEKLKESRKFRPY